MLDCHAIAVLQCSFNQNRKQVLSSLKDSLLQRKYVQWRGANGEETDALYLSVGDMDWMLRK